jgi:hypothetical protein
MHQKKLPVNKFNLLLPAIKRNMVTADICIHCTHINKPEYSFCTNCGYPLQDKLLIDAYYKKLKERNELLFKAENTVQVARIILYVMAFFLLFGILFIFSESTVKYLVATLALIISALFFFLALWSRSNPLSAMLIAVIILITFSAINIFDKLKQSFTTTQGVIGMLLCLALVVVVLKGVQAAYRVVLMKQELQMNL